MDKRKKNKVIFVLYMIVSFYGIVSVFFSETITQFILLLMISLFVFVCGIIIVKDKSPEKER